MVHGEYVLFQFVEENLGVMSVGFLLSSPDDAVIWRGPKKNGLCYRKQTLKLMYSSQITLDALW